MKTADESPFREPEVEEIESTPPMLPLAAMFVVPILVGVGLIVLAVLS